MNRVKHSTELARSIKTKRLQAKLSKIKRQIYLEYEQEAQHELEDLLETYKGMLDVQYGYQVADCFYQLRQYQTCIKVLDTLKPDENRKQPKVQNLKGLAYMKIGNTKYAIDLFEICIVIDPHYKVAYNNLGNIYMQNKDYEKCKEYYRKSKDFSTRLNNKSVACFNLALACLHTDDMLGMIKELAELELYVTPDMNVYKNLVQTGFDQMLFKPGFLSHLLILEELLYLVMHGVEPSRLTEEQTKDILGTSLIKVDKLVSTEAGVSGGFRDDDLFSQQRSRNTSTRIIVRKVPEEPSRDLEEDSFSRRTNNSTARLVSTNQPPVISQSLFSREVAKHTQTHPYSHPQHHPRIHSKGSDHPIARRAQDRKPGKSVVYSTQILLPGMMSPDLLATFSDSYKQILLNMEQSLVSAFAADSTNLVVLFYLALASILRRKYVRCSQAISLSRALHSLNHSARSSIVLDYYLAKINNLNILMQKIGQVNPSNT